MKKIFNIFCTVVVGTYLSAVGVLPGMFMAANAATIMDSTNQPTSYSRLPACNAARDMSQAAITDGPANPTFGQSVTGGGGSAHVLLMCNGTASTPTWTVFAGGNGGSSGTTVSAPVTASGNYGNGCSGTSCLIYEDTFTASSLDLNKWRAGYYGNLAYLWSEPGGYCGGDPGQYPFSK